MKNTEIQETNIRLHRFGSAGFAGFSLLLLLIDAPVFVLIALGGFLAGGSYSLATVTLSDTIKSGQSRLQRWCKLLDERQVSLDKRDKDLKAEREKVKTALTEVQDRLKGIQQEALDIKAAVKVECDREIKARRAALAAEFEQMGEDQAAELALKIKAANDDALKRIKFHKSRLIADNAELHSKIVELETQLEQRDNYLLEEFNKRLDTYREGYTEMNAAIECQGRTVGEAKAAFEAQYHALIDERDRLAMEVKRLSAPKRFRRNTDNDLRGNRILEFYREKGIALEGEDWDAKFNHVDYFLYPLQGAGVASVKLHLEDLKVALGFYSTPTATADNGFIRLGVKIANQPEDITVPTRPLSKLEQTIRECNHVSIVGSSGSGKSVFVDNIIRMGQLIWPDSEQTIFDPKFQLENWHSGLKPDYKNQKCVAGISDLSGKLYTRLEEYEELTDAGLEPKEYPRHMFVVDEAQQLYMNAQDMHIDEPKAKYPAQVSRSFTRLLNLGRALGVRGYFIRHNDLVKPLGLNDGQFDGCVNIFLGKGFITKALNKSLKDLFSDAKLAAIQAEYDRRLKLGQQYIALIADIPKSDIYLIKMPAPGHYHRQWTQEIGNDTFQVLGGVDPRTHDAPKVAEVIAGKEIDAGDCSGVAVQASTALAPAKGDLSTLLKAGTHCPKCGHHSARYSKSKPNGKGNVSVKCLNKECSTKTFSWKVV